MNPQEQQPQPAQPQPPQPNLDPTLPQPNTTAQEYAKVKADSNSKKFLYVVIMIAVGLILIAGIAVAAYYATGDRTEEKINQLETELKVPDETEQKAPSTE